MHSAENNYLEQQRFRATTCLINLKWIVFSRQKPDFNWVFIRFIKQRVAK